MVLEQLGDVTTETFRVAEACLSSRNCQMPSSSLGSFEPGRFPDDHPIGEGPDPQASDEGPGLPGPPRTSGARRRYVPAPSVRSPSSWGRAIPKSINTALCSSVTRTLEGLISR